MTTWVKLVAVLAITMPAPAFAQDAAGDWFGVLEVTPQARIPLVVHIKRDDAGVLTGTLDSPAQGASDLPLAEIVADGGRLTFKVPVVSGTYEGTWDESSKTWRGTWSQGMSLPLVLGVAPATLPAIAAPPPPLPADWQLPSDAEIEALIAGRIAPRAGQGVVIGVLSPEGERIVAGGPAGSAEFDGDTLFEIGSISKVFTALILADMAAKGEVSLDDPAEKYLPAGATMPARGGRKITLRDLAQHVSGLPRLPGNMPYGDVDDPYADYGEPELLAFLASYELPRDIGAQQEYSNLGVGLLGYLLARAAGTDYATLLRERITGPIGMSDTAIALSPDQQRRFAPGHDAYLRPAKPWHLGVLAGAGAVRSTTADMLEFAAALLDPGSPIAPAMRLTLAERRGSGNTRSEQGLAWSILHPVPEREILMHDGGTGGYRSTLVLEPAKMRAVVVLANSAAEPAAADLALSVLAGSPAAPTPPVPPTPARAATRTEVALPVAELDRVVGRYEFAPGVVFAVTREGTAMRAQRRGSATGPVLPIFAEAPLRFFYKAINGQIEFITDADGRVTSAEAMLDGQKLVGRKLEP